MCSISVTSFKQILCHIGLSSLPEFLFKKNVLRVREDIILLYVCGVDQMPRDFFT